MVFFYDKNAGSEILDISGENFSHLRARRLSIGDRVDFRNLRDESNYIYEITEISRKNAVANLVFKNSVISPKHEFCLAWAVVEPSVIEKTLPSLNEMGVAKIIFVYSDFSQKNVRMDLDRMKRILINSSCQCGRNSVIELEILSSSDDLLNKYPNSVLIDFEGKSFEIFDKNEIPFIGPEGGFSENERKKFSKSYELNLPYILRSNTAIMTACARLIF
ncbi:MAG: 16S rRNA (uracil(1498)-N(3))-methyltransferase [Campylobacter sp.]|nr:16S rRNA (uracil(1498)-N(3))-methyltransferase [Campylobacter sp.]